MKMHILEPAEMSVGNMTIDANGDHSFTQEIFPSDDAWYSGGDRPSEASVLTVTDRSKSNGTMIVRIEDSAGVGAEVTIGLASAHNCGQVQQAVFSISNGEEGEALRVTATPFGFTVVFDKTHDLVDYSTPSANTRIRHMVRNKKSLS